MPATPRIEYYGLPGTGVELFGVDAPEFRDLLKPCSPVAADTMWLAVIVQNASAKALTAVLVRYEACESGGRTHAADFLWHTTQNLEHRKALPGECVLVVPVLGVARIVREDKHAPRGGGNAPAGAQRLARFAQAERVQVRLDSVIFDDGRLIGPDAAGLEKQMTAWLRAERDLHDTLLRMPAGERRRYLEGIAGDPVSAWNRAMGEGDESAAHRYGVAAILLGLCQNAAGEEQFLSWLDQTLGHPVPLPRRAA